MKYFVVMMFLFMTSGVFVAKDNNVCIKILDVDWIRLKGVEVKIYEAGKGWQISSTDENGDAYFLISINHVMYLFKSNSFLDPKPKTSFI
ncbi:MAG: hypothetical protein ACLTZT_06400 [Butyricimonas faecalis]